jgi:hypothetical protein
MAIGFVQVRTEDRLRGEIQSARVFIGIITPASSQSAYVLFELGARWGANLPLKCVIAAGATPEILPGPLKAYISLRLDREPEVIQLLEEIGRDLNKSLDSPAAYHRLLRVLVEKSQAETNQVSMNGEAAKVATPRPVPQQADENDAISKLESYLNSLRGDDHLITFADIDSHLNLPQGTTRKYIELAADAARFDIKRTGEMTVLLHRRFIGGGW